MPFTNVVSHAQMTTNLLNDFKSRIRNPYYLFNDKSQTPCTYFNLNKEQTTLDEGLQTHYDNLGDQSPLRFNQINNFYLFGIGKFELNAEYGDWGVEASEINGEAYVLPNTIVPYVNDYFSINYLDKDLLFKVTSVSPGTLDYGGTFYKVEYVLDQHGWEEGNIYSKVDIVYTMKVENYGTDTRCILTQEESEFQDTLGSIITKMQQFYRDMYYNNAVQTFTFQDLNHANFYDPYMIEFLIRNQVLKGGEYLYLDHRTIRSKMFNMEYERTVFRAIEQGSMEKLKKYNNEFCGIAVVEPTSLLSTRYEAYYQMTYSKYSLLTSTATFKVFSTELFDHITEHKFYEEDRDLYKNIIVRFFNGDEYFSVSELNKIMDNIDWLDTIELFYLLPVTIFILRHQLSESLGNANDTNNSSANT